MLEPELCSNRGVLSPFREESGDEELSVLPRHTKVIVTGNNRTKSVLVGLQGVVKKAVGLGGWHWLVLKNGVEVKLQRNALSVLEHPTGNEVDEDHDFDSSSGSDIASQEFVKQGHGCRLHQQSWLIKVNLARLGTDSLRRYCRHYNLANISSDSSREQMLNAVQRHFTSQPKLSEVHVISEFVNAVMKATKRRKPVDRHME
ncbi:SAP30 Sin3 bdg domain-containing protein [Citrus sinensis]|nr:SAP30 Sin3 bdg domain-containing protein [Citrus sinensis]